MTDSSLGLSEPHSSVVVEYLRFSRFRRSQCLKSVQTSFQNLVESRLVEDTFTNEEVEEMMTGLSAVVLGDMEMELIHSSHINVLLLQQLFQQADSWHLSLRADISAMENKELLEAVAQYERHQFSSSPSSLLSPLKATLQPLDMSGGEKLLQREISRLKEENEQLLKRLHTAEEKVSKTIQEKEEMITKLSATHLSAPPPPSPSEEALGQRIADLEAQLVGGTTSDNTSMTSDLQEELTEKSKSLLRVRAELKKLQEELEKKFSDTTQYLNMRKMLATKNEQIKDLRAKIKE